MEDIISVQCSNCGFVFQNEDPKKPSSERKLCPKCGSQNRTVHLVFKETLELVERMKLKARKPTSTHKKRRPDYELEKGKKIGKDGNLVSIERIIDRDSNYYKETVKDKDDKVIVNKEEKLSEHRQG